MGNVTISNDETTIYYPSDWLVDGGPTFETMNCPEDLTDHEETIGLILVLDDAHERWRIVSNGHVLMESKSIVDLIAYFAQYMVKVEQWVEETK